MKSFSNALRGVLPRNAATITAATVAVALAAAPHIALAQENPFAGATAGAEQFRAQLASFALIVGGIGMVACLMLGFFGKLNWKWVATGVGVSFSIAVVPGAIRWLSTLAGASPTGM